MLSLTAVLCERAEGVGEGAGRGIPRPGLPVDLDPLAVRQVRVTPGRGVLLPVWTLGLVVWTDVRAWVLTPVLHLSATFFVAA